jgi:hypothetical protein
VSLEACDDERELRTLATQLFAWFDRGRRS